MATRVDVPARSSSRRFRLLSVAVLAIGLGASVVTSSAIGNVMDEQEHRLLDERASEAALFLGASMRDIELTMVFTGRVLQLAPEPTTIFQFIAGGLDNAGIDGGGLAEERDGAYEILADTDGATGPVTPEWEALLRRAAQEGELVTGVLPSENATMVGFAYAPEDADWVLFQQVEFDPSETLDVEAGDPFSGLEGAVYASGEAVESNLVIRTTDDLTFDGDVVRHDVEVGADDWLLVATAGGTTESFAGDARWWVLGGGALLALLTSVLVDVLGRRRAYAMRLVDDRTAALQASLAEQAKLEQGQRLAREAAEAANRSKSEFLSRMSHELRTPLNAVLGFAQLLELDPLEPSQQEAVTHILKGGRHLLNLINEVLDITRIETGNFSLSPEPVAARHVVADVLDLMRPLAQHHGITMTDDGAVSCPAFVVADAQRLRQILLNLVANAIKYNRVGGTVSLSCSEVGAGELRISVADTGAGIDQDRLPLLFTPFERLGAEQTDIEGTGVGLALSRRLAEVMGGTLDVDTAVGRGSTFWVQLPLAEDPMTEQLPALAAEPARHTAAARGAHTVLYIEDNLSNLRLVERLFESRPDLELITAGQGRLGLDLARQHLPALVLLDLHLPDINGNEVLEQLRSDPITAHVPVIMLSADATARQSKRLLDAGADAYLTKPLDVRTLLTLLDETLGRAAQLTPDI